MRLLIDAHILLWVLEANPRLSARAAELIHSTSNEVFVSAASLLEISIKKRLANWTQPERLLKFSRR